MLDKMVVDAEKFLLYLLGYFAKLDVVIGLLGRTVLLVVEVSSQDVELDPEHHTQVHSTHHQHQAPDHIGHYMMRQ